MAQPVFFSFDYQDVIDFRANVCWNHNVTKRADPGWGWRADSNFHFLGCGRPCPDFLR